LDKGKFRFALGRLVATRRVADRLAEDSAFARFVLESMRRHANGDWGNLDDTDKQENSFSVDKHLRILSAYEEAGLPKIWIITEADRSVTTVLFPEEY